MNFCQILAFPGFFIKFIGIRTKFGITDLERINFEMLTNRNTSFSENYFDYWITDTREGFYSSSAAFLFLKFALLCATVSK